MRTESEEELRTNAGCGCDLSTEPPAAEKRLFLLACYHDQIIVKTYI
jgi:hypothetical protein